MKRLNPIILKLLSKKTGMSKHSVQNELSKVSRQYSSCTPNARAQIYALSRGTSVLQKLDEDDKATLPHLDIQKPTLVTVKPEKRKEKRVIEFLNYPTTNKLYLDHISEINRAYSSGCFTAVFILIRKVLENLLIDVLRVKYPSTKKEDKELYFDLPHGRFQDFSIILKNLREKASDFQTEKKLVERLCQLADNFKDDANDKTHSLYHIVKNGAEIDKKEPQRILDLIVELNSKLKPNPLP